MTLTHISIFCLPNVRAPWVVVYEPHPWGHGALRVKEESAVLIYERPPTDWERDWCKDFVRHMCRTFTTVEAMLEYEDGQHENVADIKEMLEVYKTKIAAILAEVERKREEKRKKAVKQRKPLPMAKETNPVVDDDIDEETGILPPY